MTKFEITFQSVIQVTRTYEVEDGEDEDYAKSLAQMDAEDGQIGHFHERHCVGGDVIESRQLLDA